jgi:hypothetical protein
MMLSAFSPSAGSTVISPYTSVYRWSCPRLPAQTVCDPPRSCTTTSFRPLSNSRPPAFAAAARQLRCYSARHRLQRDELQRPHPADGSRRARGGGFLGLPDCRRPRHPQGARLAAALRQQIEAYNPQDMVPALLRAVAHYKEVRHVAVAEGRGHRQGRAYALIAITSGKIVSFVGPPQSNTGRSLHVPSN